mgnify:CR=1 FL=1
MDDFQFAWQVDVRRLLVGLLLMVCMGGLARCNQAPESGDNRQESRGSPEQITEFSLPDGTLCVRFSYRVFETHDRTVGISCNWGCAR